MGFLVTVEPASCYRQNALRNRRLYKVVCGMLTDLPRRRFHAIEVSFLYTIVEYTTQARRIPISSGCCSPPQWSTSRRVDSSCARVCFPRRSDRGMPSNRAWLGQHQPLLLYHAPNHLNPSPFDLVHDGGQQRRLAIILFALHVLNISSKLFLSCGSPIPIRIRLCPTTTTSNRRQRRCSQASSYPWRLFSRYFLWQQYDGRREGDARVIAFFWWRRCS